MATVKEDSFNVVVLGVNEAQAGNIEDFVLHQVLTPGVRLQVTRSSSYLVEE